MTSKKGLLPSYFPLCSWNLKLSVFSCFHFKGYLNDPMLQLCFAVKTFRTRNTFIIKRLTPLKGWPLLLYIGSISDSILFTVCVYLTHEYKIYYTVAGMFWRTPAEVIDRSKRLILTFTLAKSISFPLKHTVSNEFIWSTALP